jgi:carboxypeptidase family protein/TonB-dependent receptor-like protein
MRSLVVRNRLRLLLASAALVALGTVGVRPVHAQVLYGSLVGDVTDSTRAGVPGAAVTITNKATNQSRETTSDTTGTYRFVNVQPGAYTVKVSMSGFKEYVKENVPVTPNTISRVDVSLAVGQLTEAVTVQSERTLLQTDKGDLHSELSSKEVTSLPLGNYRNYQTLINLTPGATPARFQNAVTDSPERALETNINGTNRNSNNTRLDGTTNVFIWLPHHAVYVAPAETVETVNVTTNSFDAEQGMAGGAAVTVITKSGTNEFHGSGFALHENDALRARNFFLPKKADGSLGDKPNTSRNIDGATLGGPLVKDKLFFFAAWEGTYEKGGFTFTGTVPTAAMRNGDFSGFNVTLYDPATGNQNGTGRTPFAGNVIPANRISPIAQKMQSLVPLPTRAGTANNFVKSATQTLNRNNYDVKLNLNRTSAHQIWAKASQMSATVSCDTFLGEAGGGGLCGSGGAGNGDTRVRIATLGHTWTLSPRLVLDGTFGLTRFDQTVQGPDFGSNFGLDVLGIPGTNGSDPRQSGLPQFSITGFSTIGNSEGWAPLFRNDRSYTFTNNLTYVTGKHEMRFGVDIVRMELTHWQPELGTYGPRGGFTFSGGATALGPSGSPNLFNAYADFLLGLPTQAGKSLQYEVMTAREWQYALYFRDRWQLSRNLTLNVGLRFERYPLMRRANRGIEYYDDTTNKVLLGGLGGNPTDLGIKVNVPFVAPRLGIAWRINDNNVLRAGYGMAVDPIPFARPLRGFYPLTVSQNFVGINGFDPATTLARGIPPVVGPDLSTGAVTLPTTADERSPYADHINRGYIQSWNLTYERKLPWDFSLATSYVGTQTTHQLADLNINAAPAGTGRNGQPLFQKFGRTAALNRWDGWLSSNYHALQIALNRPFSKGFFVKGAYTWSRAMNWTDDDGWAGVDWNDPSVLARNYAQAGYNIPHIFQLGFVADLPFGKNSTSALGTIVKNWQINGVASAYSGRPFNIRAPSAALNAPGNVQTPNLIGPITQLGGIGAGNPYYDPTSFAAPAAGTFGNVGRNLLRGPGAKNLDLSLFRRFGVTNRVNVEARIEAFNVTNTPHFNNPSTGNSDISAGAGFLTITSAAPDERQIRLGLRIVF